MNATAKVELGRIAPPTALVGEDYRGQVLYLPDLDVMVAVEAAGRDGWWCRILAGRHGTTGDAHVCIRAETLAAGHTSMQVDATTDPDSFVMVWLARVWVTWPGGRTAVVARVLRDEARLPNGLELSLTEGVCRRVLNATHITGPGLRRLLDKLVTAGLLMAAAADGHGEVARFRLVLPGACF